MTKSVVAFQPIDQLPAHIAQGSGLGNENVTSDDMAIPRLDILQPLSPQLKKSDSKFIAGAEQGQIFNNMTGEVFDACHVVNLFFEMTYPIFKDRQLGFGFEGRFDTEKEAQKHMADAGLDDKVWKIVPTAVHSCILLDEAGKPKTPVQMYMSSSKLAVSNAWNTQISTMKYDRFATVWTLSTHEEQNRQGSSYHNYKLALAGGAPDDLYAEARAMYFSMRGIEDPMASDTVH